ncbi:MAG: hypothetical protein ACREFX_07975 [Opitutaceae bacterium]
MNPESEAWQQLREKAAAQIRPGFADRVIRAARAAIGPSAWSQFAIGAATAALCLIALAFFQASQGQGDRGQSLAGWRQVSQAADEMPAQ